MPPKLFLVAAAALVTASSIAGATAAPSELEMSLSGAAQNATQAPIITAGRILTATVNTAEPLASPRINFQYSAPNHFLGVSFGVKSPSGKTFYVSYESLVRQVNSGSITIQDSTSDFGIYAQPGTYTLTSASIIDAQQQRTDYSGSQLAELFPILTFQVVNP